MFQSTCHLISSLILFSVDHQTLGEEEYYPAHRFLPPPLSRQHGELYYRLNYITAISFDFCDFTRFQPDFTYFRFFQPIQPVMHVLTRKIVTSQNTILRTLIVTPPRCNFDSITKRRDWEGFTFQFKMIKSCYIYEGNTIMMYL